VCWHEVGVAHSTCWLLVRRDGGLVADDGQQHHTGTIKDYDIVLKGSEWVQSAIRQGVLRIEPGYWSPSTDGRANFKPDFGPSTTCGLVALPPGDILWTDWEKCRPQDYDDWPRCTVVGKTEGASP
jgi:hypothetical protein